MSEPIEPAIKFKPPIIRRGQRRPYVKGSQAQIDQRIGFVARMLDTGATKVEIHRAVRQQFNIEWRQSDRYISWLARAHAKVHRNLVSEMCKKVEKSYFSGK